MYHIPTECVLPLLYVVNTGELIRIMFTSVKLHLKKKWSHNYYQVLFNITSVAYTSFKLVPR